MRLDPVTLLATLGALVLGITVHEFSHALVAYKLGDRTAQRMGRLTLSPLAHLDPLGSLMILISSLSGFGIGWGKPTPVSPWSLRPRGRIGMALVALGGPVSNLLVALVLATGLRLVPAMPYIGGRILIQAIVVNLALTAFNLLPLPMLDGFHVLMGAVAGIRARWAYDLGLQLGRLEPHGPMILLVLVMLGSFMRPAPLTLLIVPVINLLLKIVGLG
jgi:Zn-dependent protease